LKAPDSIFNADPEGFRSQNSDRPPAHLVRELIQNALDEDGVTTLDVNVEYHGQRKGTTVTVRDDAPGGVRDARLLFTLWLSDKEDSPTKRGRMGRGFKELVSVSDKTVIRSCSIDAMVFERRRGGVWRRTNSARLGRPERGTEVTAFVGGWGDKAAKDICAFVRRVRAPARISMRLNGEPVAPFAATESYQEWLETVVYEVDRGERVARERFLQTTVECFSPPPGEKAYVYEMGIPVEACDSPVSIDVGQRVILRERRDTLTETYKRTLFAKVLSLRISKLTDEQLKENAALTAAQGFYFLSDQAKQRIAGAWTAGKPFAATPQTRHLATGHHVECVPLRSLPEAVREIVKTVNQNVTDVLDARRGEFCPELHHDAMTPAHDRLVKLWEWIAAGISRPCRVVLRDGNPGAVADFSRDARVLSVYMGASASYVADPAGGAALGTLIHELAHWTAHEDAHGAAFHADGDDVGGAVAAFLLANAEQARLLLAERGQR
jgi:hypothetical protein